MENSEYPNQGSPEVSNNETERFDQKQDGKTRLELITETEIALHPTGVFNKEYVDDRKRICKKYMEGYGNSMTLLGGWAAALCGSVSSEDYSKKEAEIEEFNKEVQNPNYQKEIESYKTLGHYVQEKTIEFKELSQKDKEFIFHCLPNFFGGNKGFGGSGNGIGGVIKHRIAFGELGLIEKFSKSELDDFADGVALYAETIIQTGIEALIDECEKAAIKDKKDFYNNRAVRGHIEVVLFALRKIDRYGVDLKVLGKNLEKTKKILTEAAPYIAEDFGFSSPSDLVREIEGILQ
jgi:hypothetical protein